MRQNWLTLVAASGSLTPSTISFMTPTPPFGQATSSPLGRDGLPLNINAMSSSK